MSTRDQLEARQAAAGAAARELHRLYAQVAADPAGRQVLGDIASDLADVAFDSRGCGSHADGFLARYRAASRISDLIRRGQKGD